MQFLLSIEDQFHTKDGDLVISGVNPEWDQLCVSEIKTIIGDRIKIVQPNGDNLIADITDLDITNSIIDKKNIHIRLKHPFNVENGARAYKSLDRK